MTLERLYLSRFRNHSYRELEFTRGTNLITGDNGSGKTSILEAIRYLSFGRSFRARYDREAVNWSGSGFELRGELRDREVENIALRYDQEASSQPKKQVLVDGTSLEQLSQLQGVFPTVLHYPLQLELLTGPPGKRRQFINQLLGQSTSGYISALKEYREALKQRNSLVKRPEPDELLLSQYEEKMADSGRKVIKSRRELLNQIEEMLEQEIQVTGEKLVAELELDYQPGFSLESKLKSQLQEERSRALERGYTTIGCHRDNWELQKRGGLKLEEFSSRGELKLILIALKFVENRYILETTGKEPVFLVDDFHSELDKEHRCLVLDRAIELGFQFICTSVRQSEKDRLDKIIEL